MNNDDSMGKAGRIGAGHTCMNETPRDNSYCFSTLIFFPFPEAPLLGDRLPSFPTVITVPSLLYGLSRHISLFKHSPHLGLIGAQMV